MVIFFPSALLAKHLIAYSVNLPYHNFDAAIPITNFMNNSFGINIIPSDDEQRIDALKRYKIFNTPAEGAFDNVAKLAAQIFKVPISLISLVGADEVFFKANIGMGNARSTARGVSLCSLAVLDPEVTVFENAMDEPCLLANPNVAGEFGLRFYAGAPLITHDGFPIGTLCVIDKTERKFDAEDRLILQGLARIVMDEIELRLDALKESEKLQDINKKLESNNKDLNEAQLSLNTGLEKLSASESRLRFIFRDAPVAISTLIGRDLIIESANSKMLEFWDQDESFIGNPLRALPGLDGQPVLQLFDQVFTTGIPFYSSELKASLRRKNKSEETYYNVVFQPVCDESGAVHSIILVATDVSELVNTRRESQQLNEELYAINEEMTATNEELSVANEALADAQAELKEVICELSMSEAKFRNVIKQAPVAIGILKGRDLLIETANAKLLSFWGRTEAILNMPLAIALPEFEGQPFLQILDNVITSGIAYANHEIPTVLNHHGVLTTIYLDLLYHPLKNEEGITESILVVATDLTEQVKARKKVEQAEENLRIATESANLAPWTMDAKTGEFIASERLKQIFGLKPEMEMTYEIAINQVRSDYQKFAIDAVSASMDNAEIFNIEYPIIELHEGKERWIRSVGKLINNQNGTGRYLTGVLLDITEQRKDEQRKNDFIGMVSHELKTPLTSLNAYIQMLKNKAGKNADTFSFQALEKANKQVGKMTTMINGFLNLSRLESGKINIDKTTFDMAELMKEVEKETHDSISSHRFVFEPVEITFVEADQDKINQVITNFISNAVKYSPVNSTIQIACVRVKSKVVVSVKDQGMGIAGQDLQNLFDRYYRVENHQTKTISGFGIGLYICSEILQRHDGDVWVESELGNGSTFYFSLPLLFEN